MQSSELSSEILGALGGGMGAFADSLDASASRNSAARYADKAAQAKAWEDFARDIGRRALLVIDARDALAKELADTREQLEHLQRVHTIACEMGDRSHADAKKLLAERDIYRARYRAVSNVLTDIVKCVRSRTTEAYFPELTDEAIKEALAKALR